MHEKRKGQVIIEFLVVIICLLMFVALLLETGRAVITYQTMSNAVSVGARQGTLTKQNENLTVARRIALEFAKENVPFARNGQTHCESQAVISGPNQSGSPLKVSMTCTLTPLFSQFFLPNWTEFKLDRSIIMLLEDV